MIESLEELEKFEIKTILREGRVPINWLGYKCIITAVPILISNFNSSEKFTLKNLYSEVAKKHRTTSSKVECAIRYVCENTYINKVFHTPRVSNGKILYLIADKIMTKLNL